MGGITTTLVDGVREGTVRVSADVVTSLSTPRLTVAVDPLLL
jgi:hypothetical protein